MELWTTDKNWDWYMEAISKCKIIVKQSKKESPIIHPLPILANSKKKCITLSLKRSSSNSKTSFISHLIDLRPERIRLSGNSILQKDVSLMADASTRNWFQTWHPSGLINLERNWKIRPIADLREVLRTVQRLLIPPTSTRMPMEFKFFQRSPKLSLIWMLELWTNVWPSALREWVLTHPLPPRELVDMMLRPDSSSWMKTLEKPLIITTMQRTISSTCKNPSRLWPTTHTSTSKTEMKRLRTIKVNLNPIT